MSEDPLLAHLRRLARQVEEQPERAADWQLELFNAVFRPLDAALTDRVVGQLRRAVAHGRAFEQGRSEERRRIAQDLHDDIGARLLTLMYKAPSAEMEDYVRQTLKDLKTLTRGLAAACHVLSHAAAEWKADITQRLAPTGCALAWSFEQDAEIRLSVGQWSGLTRILRELVSNLIAHAQATHATIHGELREGLLALTVSDDGVGGTPADWPTGLGLSGIRKRVRLLDGTIAWTRNMPAGVRCEVRVPLTSMPAADADPAPHD